MSQGWIGVDLDRTLAHYDHWRGAAHIGAPIPLMVERVKNMLKEGRDVRIFTARIYPYSFIANTDHGTLELRYPQGVGVTRNEQAIQAAKAIQKWCYDQFGQVLPIASQKDYDMLVLFDDRAVAVEPNTGVILGGAC